MAVLLMFLGCSQQPTLVEPKKAVQLVDLANTTVAITNLQGTSGGSGVIVSHNPHESFVLTNAHVCGVVENSGFVHTDYAKYLVESFAKSRVHDLCLIRVASDLHYSVLLAPHSPEIYTKSYVSGHPHLLPTIITEGHFSGRRTIQLMVGVRDCTKEDLQNPATRGFCIFFGQLPIFRNFDSQVISPTILPGSSGSGVYDSEGKLSGLVFAGTQGLSYAMIVPWEYIFNFFFLEEKFVQHPSNTLGLEDVNEGMSDQEKLKEEAEEFCLDNKNQEPCKVWLSN